MSSKNSIDEYAKKEEKQKKGWYLLVTHKKKGVVKNFDYRKLEKVVTEHITTTALNLLKKDGFLHDQEVEDLLDYEITLLSYSKYKFFSSKNKLLSRYIMKYKSMEEVSGLNGYYDNWEYTVSNKKGEFEPFDKKYTYLKAHRFPLIWSLFQILLSGLAYIVPNELPAKYYDVANMSSAFILFVSGLMYSAFSVWKKDLIKRHYLKDNLKRIKRSLFTFELPVIITAFSTVWKISPIAGKFTWNFAIFGILLIVAKIYFTYVLEREKQYK